MKKVQLKLKQHELESLLRLLLDIVTAPDRYAYDIKDDNDRVHIACLGELYHKLKASHSDFVQDYKIKVHVSQALAFRMLWYSMPQSEQGDIGNVLINQIAGSIHRQTL